jgi:hypothetical protein
VTVQIAAAVAEHGSRLPEVDGVGPVVAGRLLGRIRNASRFSSASAFANYTGVARASGSTIESSWPAETPALRVAIDYTGPRSAGEGLEEH